LGRFDQAIPQFQEAIRRNPTAASYGMLTAAFLFSERPDEAKTTLDQAIAHGFAKDRPLYYNWAFLVDDQATMQQVRDWSTGKPDVEGALLDAQSYTEAFHGRLRRAREYSRRAVESAKQNHLTGSAASYSLNSAVYEIEFGNVVKARENVAAALALASDFATKSLGALVLARSGDSASALKLAAELEEIGIPGRPGLASRVSSRTMIR